MNSNRSRPRTRRHLADISNEIKYNQNMKNITDPIIMKSNKRNLKVLNLTTSSNLENRQDLSNYNKINSIKPGHLIQKVYPSNIQKELKQQHVVNYNVEVYKDDPINSALYRSLPRKLYSSQNVKDDYKKTNYSHVSKNSTTHQLYPKKDLQNEPFKSDLANTRLPKYNSSNYQKLHQTIDKRIDMYSNLRNLKSHPTSAPYYGQNYLPRVKYKTRSNTLNINQEEDVYNLDTNNNFNEENNHQHYYYTNRIGDTGYDSETLYAITESDSSCENIDEEDLDHEEEYDIFSINLIKSKSQHYVSNDEYDREYLQSLLHKEKSTIINFKYLEKEQYYHLRNSECNSVYPEKNQQYYTQLLEGRQEIFGLMIYLQNQFTYQKILPETYFLATQYFDKYMTLVSDYNTVREPFSLQKLKVLAITSLFMASKYTEIDPPNLKQYCDEANKVNQVKYFQNVTFSQKVTKDHVKKLEIEVLKSFNCELSIVSCYQFLIFYLQYLKLDKPGSEKIRRLCFYLCELAGLNHKMAKFSGSLVAISIIFMAYTLTNQCCPINLKKFPYSQQIIDYKELDKVIALLAHYHNDMSEKYESGCCNISISILYRKWIYSKSKISENWYDAYCKLKRTLTELQYSV